MKTIREGVEEYIRMRRALGFKLQHVDKMLFDFISFSSELPNTNRKIIFPARWLRFPCINRAEIGVHILP